VSVENELHTFIPFITVGWMLILLLAFSTLKLLRKEEEVEEEEDLCSTASHIMASYQCGRI
ncbi:MAG: hypothetical protein ACI8RD_014144, partial [Bacillariaceae sp.]|jgi:hypothetical protein